MLGRSMFSGYFSLALIVLILRHVFKVSGIQLLLGGLHSYYCVDPSADPRTRLKQEDLKTKKGRKQFVKQQIEIRGASTQVYRQTLSIASLQSLLFSDDVNVLVTLSLAMMLNSVVVLLAAALLGTEVGVVTVGISLVLVVYTVFVCVKVDYAAVEARATVDSMVMFGVMFIGTACAMTAIMMGRHWTVQAGHGGPLVPLLSFDVRDAAAGFDALLGGVHDRVAQKMKTEVKPPPSVDPAFTGIAVAIWAGMISVAMLGPAMHYSKLLYRTMQVPAWGEAYMGRSWITIKLLQLGFIAPLLMALSQITPLASYWGLDPKQAPVVAAVLLLLVALTHYLTTGPLAQSYLDGGLAEWHTLLHNGHDFEGKMQVVRLRLDLLRSLLGKACAQLVSPALITCSLGLLLLLHTGLPEQVATRCAAPRQAMLARLPPSLAKTIAYVPPSTASGSSSSWQGANITIGVPPSNLTVAPKAAATDSATDSVEAVKVVEEQEGLLGLTEDGTEVTLETSDAEKIKSAIATESHPVAASSEKSEVVEGEGSAAKLWQFLAHFLGWWTCVTWSVYACCSLAVYRMGLNSS